MDLKIYCHFAVGKKLEMSQRYSGTNLSGAFLVQHGGGRKGRNAERERGSEAKQLQTW
jgi:hypothetical protein